MDIFQVIGIILFLMLVSYISYRYGYDTGYEDGKDGYTKRESKIGL